MTLQAAFALSLIIGLIAPCTAQASGSAVTTRYWDCCKGSCSWPEKAPVSQPLGTCDRSDNPISDALAASGCEGGPAFMCSNQSPWAVDANLAYGYAAVNIAGGTESSWCCACYQLSFTNGPVAGKTMIVQATNTGGDLANNQFDIAMPGGGQGLFSGCSAQYGGNFNWGQQYGGVSSRAECEGLPERLRAGCYWRFDWFMGADNPTAEFREVQCPSELTSRSGCSRV